MLSGVGMECSIHIVIILLLCSEVLAVVLNSFKNYQNDLKAILI